MLKRTLQDPAVTLTSVRGVVIRVHASFLFLPLWALYTGLGSADRGRGSLFMVALAILLYVCAGLHELGHIVVARRYGAFVSRIRISVLGAFVQVVTPAGLTLRQNFMIALGGPAASALLSVVLLIVSWPYLAAHGILVVRQRDLAAMIVTLAGTNVLLTVFNLLPVFPMDGGQAINAVLARYLRPAQATQVVSVFGQVVAVALVLGVAFASSDLLVRFTGIITAGLVSLISFKAQRAAMQQAA